MLEVTVATVESRGWEADGITIDGPVVAGATDVVMPPVDAWIVTATVLGTAVVTAAVLGTVVCSEPRMKVAQSKCFAADCTARQHSDRALFHSTSLRSSCRRSQRTGLPGTALASR